jgi:hypothetical protein
MSLNRDRLKAPDAPRDGFCYLLAWRAQAACFGPVYPFGVVLMHCWPRYLLWLVITVLGMGSMISACGQKGDLYLPEKEETAEQR